MGGAVPDLTGRRALVTGAAHGIGAAIVQALREHGAIVHSVGELSAWLAANG